MKKYLLIIFLNLTVFLLPTGLVFADFNQTDIDYFVNNNALLMISLLNRNPDLSVENLTLSNYVKLKLINIQDAISELDVDLKQITKKNNKYLLNFTFSTNEPDIVGFVKIKSTCDDNMFFYFNQELQNLCNIANYKLNSDLNNIDFYIENKNDKSSKINLKFRIYDSNGRWLKTVSNNFLIPGGK